MPASERSLKFLGLVLSLEIATLFFSGCMFVPVHEVSVDAISGPVTAVGPGYRLVDKDPLAVRDAKLHQLVFDYVRAALGTKGVFEATPEIRPDFIVEVDYGSGRGAGSTRLAGMPPVTEYFLQLSARRPRPEGTPGKGEEIWNVRATIEEEKIELNILLPVLAGTIADYAGLDTQTEKTIKVSEKAPAVVHLKSTVAASPDPKSTR